MGQLESKEQFQKQSNVFNTRKLDKDLEQDVQRSMSIGAINTLARPQLDAGSGQAGEKKKDANEIRRSGTIRLNKTSSKVIRENKTVVKPQTREEKARAGILSMRTRLKNIEDTLLKDTMVPRMQRVDFNTLSNFKKKKRIEAAVAREDNAAYIENYMKNEHTEQVDNYPIQNPERLKLFLDDFMNNVADKEADITSDENFARSLKFNYELTRTAQEMKNYLIDAADKGYLPDGIDMDAIQKKIAYFGELKEYLDARVKVVTSPFYKYFSKADMNYTDHQINKLQEKFNSADEKYKKDNADIFEYLSAIKKLRSLNIKRSKGIASREKAIEEKARHEAEMVRTRTEKRELMDKLSEQAMNFKGADRYLDKDYDARYSKERFDFLAEEFSHVKLSDLHFADFRDMTDYHEDNVRLFEQAREMEHMFFLAVRRGDADDWSEDQMIRMRAKIRSFDAMEKLTSHMQAWVLQNRRDTLDKFTYREIWEKAVHNTGADYLASDMGNLPELGSDLEKFYNSVLKTYKDEHNDRAKTIRSMYGLMHARKNPDYDPDDEHSPEWIPGEIEQAELDRRVAGFQKNAVIMDYVRGGEAYYQSVTQNRNRLFFEEYQRKYGVDPRTVLVPTRTMMRYIGGKSGEEITRIVKTLSEGTEEEKQKIRNAVIEESRNYDIKAATGDDPEALLDNYAYKSRMEGVIANLGEMKEYFDPEEAKMIEGLYQHGHHNAETPSAFGQNIEDFRTCHGLELADLLKETPQLEEIRNWLDEYIGDENPELVYNGHTYVKADNALSVGHLLGIPNIIFSSRKKTLKARIRGNAFESKDYMVNAESSKYDELRKSGAWVDTTADDLTAIKAALEEAYKPGKAAQVNDVEAAINVLSADLAEFDIRSYKDITAGKLTKVAPLIRLAGALLPGLIAGAGHEGGIAPEFATKLGANGIRELRARCRTLSSAGTLFGPKLVRMIDIYTKGSGGIADMSSLDDMLHKPAGFYTSLKKSRDEEYNNEIGEIENFIRDLNGYDLFTPLTLTESRMRHEENLGSTDMSAQALARSLMGEENVLMNVNEGEVQSEAVGVTQLIGQLGGVFREKKITVHAREALLKLAGSAQHTRLMLSRTFMENKEKYRNEIFKIKRTVPFATRVKLGEETLEDLAVMLRGNYEHTAGEDMQIDVFLQMYADEKNQRNQAMDMMTRWIMTTPLNAFAGLGTDAFSLAGNTAALEDISHKAYTYKKLLAANPEYAKRLRNATPGRISDYERVMNKLDQMLAYSDYYRAARLLMTDSYFILHDNEELGTSAAGNLTRDQRRVFDLIRLTDTYARRIKGRMYEGRRDETGQDRVLDQYEKENSRQAYLTGRPDLTKAKPSEVAKTHDNLNKFFSHIRGMSADDKIESFERNRNRRAAGYYTDDVAAIVNARKAFKNTGPTSEEGNPAWTDKQNRIYKILYPLCHLPKTKKDKDGKVTVIMEKNSKGEDVVSTSPIGSLSFTGRAGDSDRLGANPQLARAIMDLAGNLSDDESEEELIDMVEGLTFIQREKPNMKDNDIYNYARDRWLRATKKFYDILYKSIKRYENTYGTLSADLPTACFMHSLGDGQGEYFRRTRFSQDMTQIVDELSSKYKGREVPLGEVLVEEKLLDRSEYKDAQAKCPNYYQTTATLGLQMIQTLDAIFKTMNPDPDGWGLLCAKPKGLINAEYLRLNNTFGGPQLSNAEQRKYWKTAIDTGYKGVVGDEIQLDYTRKRLNILSSSERKRIKKRREADNRVYAGTCSVLNVRTNDLYNSTLAKLNNFTLNEEQKNLIKKMIAFHPGLYRDTDENRPEDMLEISRFDGNLISFLGLGAKEGTGKDLKRRAFDYFLNRADKLRTEASDGAYDVEAIMTSGNVRTSRDVVLDSQLIKMETCHRMYDVLQEMAADRKEMNWLQSKSRAKLSKGVFANFELEAIRYELSSNFYVTMGDIGGRFETEEGRKYLAIQALGQSMTGYSTGSVENNVFGDPVMRDALRSAGIRVDDILREEKPKEEKTDKSVGAFDENLFKEELGQDVEDEIDYDDEKEKEKEKTKAAPVRTGRSKKKAKADPVRRGRPDGIDLNTLEGIEAARKLPYDQRLKIFNPIDREAHEDALVRLGIPIPQNGEELAELQQAMHEVYEDEKHVQHLRRKEGVTEEMDKHLEWLGGYYLTQNKTLDQNRAQVPINRVNIPADLNAVSDYNNLENTYEAQTGLNCYCVAGQMIFNQYVARKKGTKDVERIINQHDFRNYQPVFKPYDPALAQMGIDQEAYDDAVTEVMQYAGEHATKAGNIFELGDFLFDKLDEQGYQNNCMRRMVFNIPTADTERNLIKAGNMQSVMMNKVAEIIDAGGVVALGVFTPAGYAHYVTVTGIVGDKFKVLDSSGYGGTSKLEDISEYFGPDRSVELTWLSDEKTPEEWRAEFSNLEYDPQTGYSVRELTADMALFAAQNRGISVKKTPAEMGPDREDILEFAYIRNPLSQTAEAYERGGAGQPGAVGVQEPTSYKKTTRSKKSQAPAGEKDTDKKKSEEKSVEETTEKTDEKAVETTAGQTKDKTTEKATEKTVDKAGEKTIKEAKDKTADKAAGKIANTTVWKASDKYVTTEFPKELKGKIKNLRIHIEPEVIDEYLGKDVITEELEKKFEGYEAQISARMKAGGADASAEVQQKQEIQSHFMAEMQNLIRDRKGRCGLIAWYAAGTMLDANKEGSFANRMSDDPKHRLIARELLIMKDKDGKTSNVGRIYQGFIGYGVEDLFEGLERLDLKQFAAANDAEFVSGFAAKYDILSKLDVFEDTYRYFEENDRVHNRGNKATAARAKLDALREIRAAYEERIGQITSGDYVTSEAKPVPQSLSIDSIEGRHAEILADVRQKAAEEAVRILREELGGVDLNGKPTEVVQQLFDKVQNDESRQFPEDDAAFLRQHKNEMNEVVARCGQADYDRYDVYLIEILEKGTFRGQELEGELLDHCRHGIAEYANLRRSHLGRCKAEDWAKKFDRAYGIDTDNPFLNDHPEYRAYKKLSDEGNLDTIGETRALQERCYTAAHDVMTRLIENGYSVNEREESKLRDRKRCDEAIETVRSEYEDKYYKAHPVKKGKQRKRMEIPRVYICGKYYTDYLTIIGSTNDSVFDRMKNLNVKMSDEDRKALHQSLSLMEELNRRYIEVEVPNRTAGSDMLLITSTLKVKYVTEAEAEREKVRTLLQKYGINANKSAPWSSTVNPEKHLTQTAKSYNRLFEDKYDKTAKEIDRGLFGRKRTKKDANVRAAGNRTSSSLAACMYGMGKVSVEECNNLYRVMNTKVNKADPEELQAKAAGYEKIFGAILSFDVSELKIRSLEDCIDPACMNARLMTSMCYDFKPKFFKEYEKMIDNPDVNCTLTAEQLNEVRARQALLSDANSFFTIYVKCYELAKKYKLNLQDELAKSEEEHADAAVKVSDNRELTEFYGMLSHINRALKGGDFKPGEDPGQALERQRNKLRKKQS